MATGDLADVLRRLKNVTPMEWFGGSAPVVDGVLTGVATTWSWGYDLVRFTRAQTRIATGTHGWLDILAWDFLAWRLPRKSQEADDAYRARILPEILRPRATRYGIEKALKDFTGVEPDIIELWNPYDCLCYDTNVTGGYDTGAVYGSYDYTAQFLVRAYRPQGEGIPNVYGYDTFGGYDVQGSMELIDQADVVGQIKDSDIYTRTYITLASGTTAWVQINTGSPQPLMGAQHGLDYSVEDDLQYLPGLTG